jgi:hypothetical protein
MPRDAAGPVYEHFASSTLGRLRACDVEELVATHRRSPFGPHPDELARVLNVFRAADTAGKLVIVRLPGEDGWRIGRITGRREEGSVDLDDGLHASVAEAEHAVFVARLREAGIGAPTDAQP